MKAAAEDPGLPDIVTACPRDRHDKARVGDHQERYPDARDQHHHQMDEDEKDDGRRDDGRGRSRVVGRLEARATAPMAASRRREMEFDPGIEMQVLQVDIPTGLWVVRMRMQPGATPCENRVGFVWVRFDEIALVFLSVSIARGKVTCACRLDTVPANCPPAPTSRS